MNAQEQTRGGDITVVELARERLRAFFENAPDAYYLTDLMGTFLDANRAAETLSGYTRDELLGRSFLKSDLLPRKQLPRAAGYLAKSAMGRPVGPVETLERSNQELRDFAHVAAHDLKAPLRGIATLADWIAQDSADRIGKHGQANLSLLRQRVTRMARLIDGILRYAEIGHGEPSVEQVDTNEVVAEVLEQVAPPADVTVHLDGPLPAVPYERTHLTQVFQNLISNAVKYMDKPDGCIRVGCVEVGDFWQFHVADNGPGIEARYFDRLFRMFQTLAPEDNHESTGIGLAVVKKIVELHGGRVWVESEVGQGSTFYFTLPQASAAGAPVCPATQRPCEQVDGALKGH